MKTDGAIIVSGAASGLGAAVMQALASDGVRVAGFDLAKIPEEHRPKGATGYVCDVSDADAVAETAEKVVSDMGSIHGCVCCAGIAPGAKLAGRSGPHDAELFLEVMKVNVIGTFNLMRSAAHLMSRNTPDETGQRGVIVTTASIAAYEGQIGQIAYAASKGAVAAMTLPAARDLASLGIRVVSIAPGIFETPMVAGLPEEVRQSLAATIPFPPRLADPADFAGLVRHIFENKTLNGSVLRLDGALRMAPR
ncbi:MAG: SDR family oxidoreductase [Pseudomonadota bacterium]